MKCTLIFESQHYICSGNITWRLDCTLYNDCTMYNHGLTLYNVQCTMYTIHTLFSIYVQAVLVVEGSMRMYNQLCSFTLPLRCIAINANKYIIIKIYYVILTHGRVEYISAKESQAFSFFVNFFHCGRKSARSMKSIYRWYCMIILFCRSIYCLYFKYFISLSRALVTHTTMY